MIPIKQEAIENFITMAERSGTDYYKKIANDMGRENKPLFDVLYKNAKMVANNLDRLAEDGIITEGIKEFVAVNVMSAALAVYQTINIQTEANMLYEIYNEVKETNEKRT